jgi:MtN3 and saliva related transmembrane protein
MTEIIGWVSSFILVLTIGKQVYKQWQDETSEGVSKWLFIGQLAASLGFTIYSWLVHNWVFVVTNAVMLVNGLLGLCIVIYHRRRKKKEQQGAGGKGSAKGKLEAERA